jgi:hypothetical protein
MSIIPTVKLPLTAGTDFDFGGGDITSNGGVLLPNEPCVALGVPEALRENLLEHPLREYDDCDVAYQQALMLARGMLRDKDAGRLAEDPAFAHVLGSVASRPTVSRRLPQMDMGDVDRLGEAIDGVRARVPKAAPGREHVVVDVDSTLTPTFGRRQEGSALNYHCKANGYHPLVATDTLRREVIGFRLRKGAEHCSKGSGEFAGDALDALMAREPGAKVAVRGDSGFAAPEFYEACEGRGVIYAVRLKINVVILAEALR